MVDATERGGGRRPRALPSLLFWVAGPLIVSLLVFVGPGLWIAGRLIEDAILTNELADLAKTHDEWRRRMNDRLLEAEASAARFGRMLTVELEEAHARSPEIFDTLVGPAPDGGMASRKAGFEAKRDAVIWLPAGYRLDDEEKLFLLEAKRLTELYSAGRQGEPIDTWVIPAQNGLVMYWPSYTSYIDQIDTTVDFVNSEWMTLALPANNPEGKARWTPTSYDPAAREWMVSVVAPFFRKGHVFAGSAGHDVTVNMMVSSLSELGLYQGTQHTLMKGDGTLLVSSAHQSKIHESKGTLTVDAAGDPDLKRAFEAAKRDGVRVGRVVDNTEQRVTLAVHIATPDWYLLTDVPRGALLSSVKGLYWNYWLIATVAILAIVVLPVIVIMRITLPSVRKLVTVADRIRGGDLEQRFETSGTREFAQIGNALNAMAGQLRASFSTLEKANAELEKRVEERTAELKEAKTAADAANKAKSDFLASMSHELRTPLNGIMGYAQILRRSKALGEQEMRGIEIIFESGAHLLTLINDVLDLAKIESRVMDLNPNEVHFPSFLRSTVEICRIRAEQKGLTFKYEADREVPAGVRVDQRRLRQVLINLMGNAIKFTEKGSVTFRVAVLGSELEEPREGGADGGAAGEAPRKVYAVRLEIEDTGPGMTAEQVAQLFQPFKQVGDGKRRAEGTGLGLAISQRIVALMGSSIQVKSEVDKGSVFWTELKLVEAPDWAEASKLTEYGRVVGYEGKRRRAMVVDDKWENRAVVAKMLESIGFEVTEAADGHQGLEKATSEKLDLIITDLAMPELDGWELIKRLRKMPELNGTTIFASSASAFLSDQHMSLDAGADEFVPKPLQMDELLEKVGRHLKLTWIYDQPSGIHVAAPGLEPDRPAADSLDGVAVPTAADLEALLDFAQKGLANQIERYADKLDQERPELVPFTRRVRHLVNDFRLGEVEELLNKYIAGSG